MVDLDSLIPSVHRKAENGRFPRLQTWALRGVRRAYTIWLELVSGAQGIPWTINGITYRVEPKHRHQLAHQYEEGVARFLRERVRPGELCLNIGANIGAYVLQFCHWSAPSGRVIAFEPNPAALAVLQRHVKMNGLESRVVTVPQAAGDEVGSAILHALDADGMARLGAPNALIGERSTPVRVPVTTIDNYCNAEDIEPDWLIIDIEGFEVAALRGCRRLISRATGLKIIVEMHPNIWPSSGTDRAEAEALIADVGLRAESLTGQANPFADYGQIVLTRQ